MQRNFKIVLLISVSMAFVVPLLLARSNSGGGGSGGKSGGSGRKNGTPTEDPNSPWKTVTHSENWQYAGTPYQDCGLTGNSYPLARNGTNTYPNMSGSSTPSIIPSSYYCSIKIENTGLEALSVNTKTFGRTGSNTLIEVPRYRSYKITYELLDGCTKCMFPFSSTDKRRMYFKSLESYTLGYNSPQAFPRYYSLSNCQ